MRIAVDAMGGDNAPAAVIEGAVAAARDLGVSILLVGDRTRVDPELVKHKTRGLDIETRHAAEEVGMSEAPTAALRKSDSSLAVALGAVRDGDVGGMVFAGNTGAGMVLGAHVLGRVGGVERPAIAVRVPSAHGYTILLDAGANVDCRGTHLVQFALMGDAYARAVRHVAAPRVGLLSNGTEDGKGSAAVREAAPMLDRLPINYLGYVEGRAVFSGDVDVVVCDGFVGNLVLKSMEGFGQLIGSRLRGMLEQGLLRRLAGLVLRRPLRAFARDLDPNETGGALLLGLSGTVVKAHGSSDARAIRNAIGVAADLATARVSDEVGRSIAASLELIATQVEIAPEAAAEPGRARRLWNALRARLRRERDDGAERPDDEGGVARSGPGSRGGEAAVAPAATEAAKSEGARPAPPETRNPQAASPSGGDRPTGGKASGRPEDAGAPAGKDPRPDEGASGRRPGEAPPAGDSSPASEGAMESSPPSAVSSTADAAGDGGSATKEGS